MSDRALDLDAVTVRRVRALVRATDGLDRALHTILDRRERRGQLPGQITLVAVAECASALAELFTARCVRRVGGVGGIRDADRVRVNLRGADDVCRRQHGVALDDLLYHVLERKPRDLAAERRAILDTVVASLERVAARATSAAARDYVAEQITAIEGGSGDAHLLAQAHGAAAASAELDLIARCIDAVVTHGARDAPSVRIQNFAAAVLGSSKALSAQSDRHRRVANALLRHHDATRQHVYAHSGELSDAAARRQAFEVNGIYRDEAALTVHCFGPLVYEKAGIRFDHVARHGRLGEAAPLSLAQLRGAALAGLDLDRVVIVENQTPFLDYIDWLRARAPPQRQLVVYSGGQANWAVIELLRLVARAVPDADIVHAGDLDRSGVLILRSLAARVMRTIAPLAMSVAHHRRACSAGAACVVSAAERERLAALIAADPEGTLPCHDLLVEIHRTGRWVEQEALGLDAIRGGL